MAIDQSDVGRKCHYESSYTLTAGVVTQIAPQRANRTGLVVSNTHPANPIFLGSREPPTGLNGVRCDPNGYYGPLQLYRDQIGDGLAEAWYATSPAGATLTVWDIGYYS